MVHSMTHKAISAYVLNLTIKELPDHPDFNKEQLKELGELEELVDICAKDIFEVLIQKSTFTLEIDNYINLFSGRPLGVGGAMEFIAQELQERGVELEEGSLKVRYGIFQSKEFELVRKEESKENIT